MLEKFARYPLTSSDTDEKLAVRAISAESRTYASGDCNPAGFGGNKRASWNTSSDAIASSRHAGSMVVQSNHTRMVAAVAAKIGMKCRLFRKWVPHETPS